MTNDKSKLLKIAAALQEVEDRKLYRAIDFYSPYPKQLEFHNFGLTKRERLLMAGNRVGKTYCGAFEMACHLTGEYPEWWLGRRFNRPVKAWAASDTGTTTRDIVQTKLCGPYAYPAKYGTGMLPKKAVNWKTDVSLARGVTDLFDTVLVSHKTNGVADGKSILTFKTYEQGAKKWQGEAVDVIWCDEEPPEDVYAEGMARIAPTEITEEGGICYVTFTPLQGRSKVVLRFTDEPSLDRVVVMMTMDDAKHISPEAKKKILDGYLRWQRDARERGVPMLGSGRIFIVPVSDLTEERPLDLPAHWFYGWGIDFGIGHPFAAVAMAWDKDADTIHILHTHRMADARPLDHAAAMKPFIGTAPVSWPQDGHQREKGSAEHLYKLYKKEGLKMMAHHATHADGSNGTEAGIVEMTQYMTTNRWKVAAHLRDWFEEYENYHRKDGLIVKIKDDIMSATRTGFMMRRYFKQLHFLDPWGIKPRSGSNIAKGVDSGSHFGI
jgi:phage terminase large subunit-like protein